MSPVAQLRKEQRAAGTTLERDARKGWHVSSTHSSPFVLKLLGLKKAGEHAGAPLRTD